MYPDEIEAMEEVSMQFGQWMQQVEKSTLRQLKKDKRLGPSSGIKYSLEESWKGLYVAYDIS